MTHADFLSLLAILCLYIVVGSMDFNDAVALQRTQNHAVYPSCSQAPATSSSLPMRLASIEPGWSDGKLPGQVVGHRSTSIYQRSCHDSRNE